MRWSKKKVACCRFALRKLRVWLSLTFSLPPNRDKGKNIFQWLHPFLVFEHLMDSFNPSTPEDMFNHTLFHFRYCHFFPCACQFEFN